MSISDQLVGKTPEERAAIKAEALSLKTISLPSLIIDGYTITITERSYDPVRKLLIINFTATDSKGKLIDLNGPYQYYNPPILVFDKMVANPLYPGVDDYGRPLKETIPTFKESPLEALRNIFTDTIRSQILARSKT